MSRISYVVEFAGLGRSTIVVVSLAWFLMFTLGATAGAGATYNESTTVQDIHANVSEAEVEVHQSLSNLTAEEQLLIYTVGGPMFEVGFDVTRYGVDWGAENPGQAKVLSEVSGPIAVLGLAVYLLRASRGVIR